MKTLNIKDPEAHRLAAAIAHATGESMTCVVTEALRRTYYRLPANRNRASVEELCEIARRVSDRAKRPYVNHGKLLYDAHGLPK